jgi:hypothetical protein
MFYFAADKKASPASVSILRSIWISLFHVVVKRVCNRAARFICVFYSTDVYGICKNWVSLCWYSAGLRGGPSGL